MPNIIVYSRTTCPYCTGAKALLKSKNQTWTEFNIDVKPELREEMIKKSGGRLTVPQIFINEQHIGGFDDLRALDEAGKLDPLLK